MGKTRELFKKIRDTKGPFHAKIGTIRDRNSMDLTEAEDIKDEVARIHRTTPKKYLKDTDNRNSVITHLQPDILEYEIKWALRSITMDKARGGDRIPDELFQILKDDAVKVLHSIYQQIWKTQQWPHATGKDQFSFQFQRRAVPKNVQTTTQLHLFHILARACSKSSN